jgi:hypothetical protein
MSIFSLSLSMYMYIYTYTYIYIYQTDVSAPGLAYVRIMPVLVVVTMLSGNQMEYTCGYHESVADLQARMHHDTGVGRSKNI